MQIGTQNSLKILEDPKAEVVDEIAAKLGLRKVRTGLALLCLCLAVRKAVSSPCQLHGVLQHRWGTPKSGLSVGSS